MESMFGHEEIKVYATRINVPMSEERWRDGLYNDQEERGWRATIQIHLIEFLNSHNQPTDG